MKSKKKLAGKILKVSPKKVKFAADALDDVAKAITRSDMRGLIAVGKVSKNLGNQQSRSRARKLLVQKRKGRRKGKGSKKGTKNSIVNKKEKWMSKIRAQREFLKELRSKKLLTPKNYQSLYRKSSGGFFRNKRHIKLYIAEHNLVEKNEKA